MNVNQAELPATPLPCQVWARRCLHGRELALSSELRNLIRARMSGAAAESDGAMNSKADSEKVVAAAIRRIQSILARWSGGCHDGCETCREPVTPGDGNNISRCQVLMAHLCERGTSIEPN